MVQFPPPILSSTGRHVAERVSRAEEGSTSSQVNQIGALVCAATMNERGLSLLLSYLTRGHSVTGLRALRLCAASGTLFHWSGQGLMGSDSARASMISGCSGCSVCTVQTSGMNFKMMPAFLPWWSGTWHRAGRISSAATVTGGVPDLLVTGPNFSEKFNESEPP